MLLAQLVPTRCARATAERYFGEHRVLFGGVSLRSADRVQQLHLDLVESTARISFACELLKELTDYFVESECSVLVKQLQLHIICFLVKPLLHLFPQIRDIALPGCHLVLDVQDRSLQFGDVVIGGVCLPMELLVDGLAELTGWPLEGRQFAHQADLRSNLFDLALARVMPQRYFAKGVLDAVDDFVELVYLRLSVELVHPDFERNLVKLGLHF